jgi:hypothetical protein
VTACSVLIANAQVEKESKKFDYERESRQQEIDRKDAQTRALKETQTELRERRARQSRETRFRCACKKRAFKTPVSGSEHSDPPKLLNSSFNC